MLDAKLHSLSQTIAAQPRAAGLRWQLFQYLCIKGDYARARIHLQAYAKLEPQTQAACQVYQNLLVAEEQRQQVALGQHTALLHATAGPIPWLQTLQQAHTMRPQDPQQSAALLHTALEECSVPAARLHPVAGEAYTVDFLCDGDTTLSPVLEAYLDGQYTWIPLTDIASLEVFPPKNLLGFIWAAAVIVEHTGDKKQVFIPARYVLNATDYPEKCLFGMETQWRDNAGICQGLGQKSWLSDQGFCGLFDFAKIEFLC